MIKKHLLENPVSTNHLAVHSPALPKYIPQLDGLRAIAIIGVMLFHWRVPGLNLGWAGVNLFFVLSGFLITGILLDTKKNPHYFRNFYARRFLRIFPIYYLGLAIVIIIALAFGWRIGDVWYYLFYVQNHHLALNNWIVNFPPLFDHTWSLAIEEQFYILWPLIVYALDVKKLKVVTVILYILALLTRAILMFSTDNLNLQFMLLPTQVDALAAGAFLAIIARESKARDRLCRWSNGILLVSGAGLIALALFTGSTTYWSPGKWSSSEADLPLFSLMAVFFASLISTSIFSSPPLQWALGLSWLRHIGKISYGLYLYHYPVFTLADMLMNKTVHGKPSILYSITGMVVTIGLTYVIANLSWKWFETPILKYKDRFL